jgi:hypothetical protein
MLRDDLQTDRPMMWPLSCYAAKGDEPNLLGGDSSFEEVRWVSYALLRGGQDPRQVGAKVDEYARGKENDIRAILGFPNAQLKQVLEMAAAGTMAPAGLTRVIDCAFAGLASNAVTAVTPPGMPPQHPHPQPAAGFGGNASPGAFGAGGGAPAPGNFGGAANQASPFGQAVPSSPGIGNAPVPASPFGGAAPAAGGFGGGGGGGAFGGGGGGGAFGGGGGGGGAFGGGGGGGAFGGGGGGGGAFGGGGGGGAFGGGGGGGFGGGGGGGFGGGFGGGASASSPAVTTIQPAVFGTETPSAGEDNPWTAQCFAVGAIPDAPPPREMV